MEEGAEEADAAQGLGSLADPLSVLGNEKRLHLLAFLTEPHYIREIASELGITRQSAQAHVDKLVEIGVLERRRGRREQRTVTEYVVVPPRLFAIQERFARVGRLDPDVEETEVRAVTEKLGDGEGQAGEGPPAPRLAIVHGFGRGRRIPLTGSGPWLIGREADAQVCLDFDPFVSSRHAEVRRREAAFEIGDLYSRNGTRLDWEEMDRGGQAPLENGAIVGVGRSLLVFRTP